MYRIKASCEVRKGAVYKNGELVFGVEGAVLKNEGWVDTGNGDMAGFLLSVYQHFGMNYPRFYKMDMLSKLGWLTSEVLLKDSFRAEDHRAEEVGLVLANAHSSLDTDLKYFETVKDIPSPSLFVYTLPNIMIGEICIRNHFKGESAFFVSEVYDADFMKGYVDGLMNSGVLEVCIYGWVDLLGEEGEAILYLAEKEIG